VFHLFKRQLNRLHLARLERKHAVELRKSIKF